jgi:hypothetical protein
MTRLPFSIGRLHSRAERDRWREYKCLTWLAMLEQERGRYEEMDSHCEDLQVVAARLQEDETPFVETLKALAALARSEATADGLLEKALLRLRAVDDKSYLAYALNGAARLYLQSGRNEQARQHASEALTVASIMRRRNEMAIAEALLEVADGETAAAIAGGRSGDRFARSDLSARAQSAVRHMLPGVPTASPTPRGHLRRIKRKRK